MALVHGYRQHQERGNLEGGLVRSILGPDEDRWEHLDFVKSDSDEAQYQEDAPAGYREPVDLA